MVSKLLVAMAAAGGAAYFTRSLRLAIRVHHARDIPPWFLTRQVRLRGKVVDVLQDGTVRLAHEPLVRLPDALRTANKGLHAVPAVNVKLAAVRPSAAGACWLRESLRSRRVWARPIGVAGDSLHAELFATYDTLPAGEKPPGGALLAALADRRVYSVNRSLVQRGLAAATMDKAALGREHADVRRTAAYSRLLNQLQIAAGARDGGTKQWAESLAALPVQAREIVLNSTVYRLLALTTWGARVALRQLYGFTRRHWPTVYDNAKYWTQFAWIRARRAYRSLKEKKAK